MSIIHRFILFWLLLLTAMRCSAQPAGADTLDAWLARMPSDTVRARALVERIQEQRFSGLAGIELEPRLNELLDRIDRSTDPVVKRKGRALRARSLMDRAYHSAWQTNHAVALQYLRSAWGLLKDDATHDEALTYYGMLTQLYFDVGDTSRQAQYGLRAIPHARALGDTARLLYHMLEIANAERGHFDLDSIQELGDRFYRDQQSESARKFEWAMAWTLMDEGHYAQALTRLKSSIDRHGDRLTDQDHALNHWTLGETYAKLDSLPQAIGALEQAIALSKELNKVTYVSRERLMLGDVLERSGRTREAEREWLLAAEGLRALHLMEYELDAVESLKALYAREGRCQEALRMTDRWAVLKDSMAVMNAGKEILRMEFEDQAVADSTASAQRLQREQEQAEARISRERTRRNIFLFSGLGLLVFGVVVFRQRRRTQKALDRSDELLLNILPEEVAEELKAKGHADAKHFDQVTILFTDFKGFTEASEKLSPQELVEELNTCFKAFDGIITARGIEKIKTIGDAYMCAGGLPVPASSTPAGVVQAALEMQAFMIARKKERDVQGKPTFEMRVGIHTGPVVAGIVGVKKFAYDIWGDTVNTASRMESSGEVGQVNISESTYALVKDAIIAEAGVASTHRVDLDNDEVTVQRKRPTFTFIPRGKVQAKGKGEMEMYFVSIA
jgi:class 3 adenylate cyclase/predicted negative regulator of RcsB-dependent stress response